MRVPYVLRLRVCAGHETVMCPVAEWEGQWSHGEAASGGGEGGGVPHRQSRSSPRGLVRRQGRSCTPGTTMAQCHRRLTDHH